MRIYFYHLIILVSFSFTNAQNINWINFNKAQVEAKTSNKIILIDVYTDWCKWCKEMDKNVYSNQKIIKYLSGNFISSKLNAEGSETYKYNKQSFTAPEISKYFNVDGYPATVFLNSKGEFITILPGYVEPEMFLKVLVYIKEEKYKSIDFQKYLENYK